MARTSEPSNGFLNIFCTDLSIPEHQHNQQFRITEARAPKRLRPEREHTPSLDESVLVLGSHQMRSERGFHFGSDPSQCDVYIGPKANGISGIHFRLSFDFKQTWPTVMVVTNTTNKVQGTLVNNQKLVRLMKESISQETRHVIVAGSVVLSVEFHPSKLTKDIWDALRRMASEPEDFRRLKISASTLETPNVLPNAQTVLKGFARYTDVAVAITSGMIPWYSGESYSCEDDIAVTGKSNVRKVVRVSDKQVLAVKMIINKALSSAQIAPREEMLERELRISTLHFTENNGGHPNVMKVIDFCKWEGGRLLIMEYAAYGSLEDYMHTITPNPFPEEAGRTVMVQVWRGLKWLHENDVSHGDLTALNVLLRSLHPYDCVISDFGESRKGRKQTTVPGALIYMAPEVARICQHGEDGYEYDAQQADIWSSGVIACQILTLQLPAHPKNPIGMYSTLREWAPSFEGLSQHCSVLLQKVLSQEPNFRPTATECLDDDWHVHYQHQSATVSSAVASDYRSSNETVRPVESNFPLPPTPRICEWPNGDHHPDFSLMPGPSSWSSIPDTAVPSFSSPSPEPETTATPPPPRYNLRSRVPRTTC